MIKRSQRGITLIALVVTIIVLLILAGVAITLSIGENGIFKRASLAKEETEVAGVKEYVKTDIMGEQAGNSGELLKSKFIEILNKYFEGVPTEKNFPEDLTSLTLETKEEYGSHNIKISEIYNGNFPKTVESLKVGDKVYYDTGNTDVGNKGIIECTVLYDSSSAYGIQIISSDVIKDAEGAMVLVTLGTGDTTVTGNDNFDKARNSYNRALKRLYDEAQKYLNPTYADVARCVGSDPANPEWDTKIDEAGYYTKEIAEKEGNYRSFMESYYNTLKNEDEKQEPDRIQIRDRIELKSTSADYWFASRSISTDLNNCFFSVKIASGGSAYRNTLCGASGFGGFAYDVQFAFRPVFSMKSVIKVTEGDGNGIPYTLKP